MREIMCPARAWSTFTLGRSFGNNQVVELRFFYVECMVNNRRWWSTWSKLTRLRTGSFFVHLSIFHQPLCYPAFPSAERYVFRSMSRRISYPLGACKRSEGWWTTSRCAASTRRVCTWVGASGVCLVWVFFFSYGVVGHDGDCFQNHGYVLISFFYFAVKNDDG